MQPSCWEALCGRHGFHATLTHGPRFSDWTGWKAHFKLHTIKERRRLRQERTRRILRLQSAAQSAEAEVRGIRKGWEAVHKLYPVFTLYPVTNCIQCLRCIQLQAVSSLPIAWKRLVISWFQIFCFLKCSTCSALQRGFGKP